MYAAGYTAALTLLLTAGRLLSSSWDAVNGVVDCRATALRGQPSQLALALPPSPTQLCHVPSLKHAATCARLQGRILPQAPGLKARLWELHSPGFPCIFTKGSQPCCSSRRQQQRQAGGWQQPGAAAQPTRSSAPERGSAQAAQGCSTRSTCCAGHWPCPCRQPGSSCCGTAPCSCGACSQRAEWCSTEACCTQCSSCSGSQHPC